VPKIESIRPGGTLEASFSAYPLAELLLGILRGNLTGRLDLFLHPEPRNVVFFKDGVPVSVQLPDAGVSLAKILIDSGRVPHEQGLDLLRMAEASGRSEEQVIQQHNVLSPGVLDEARRRRARAQLVRLFDASPLDFRFQEGVALPAGVPLTILQPLPLVYEGLVKTQDRTVVNRFLEAHARSTFDLAPTFPRGVDPFEWGPQVERVVTQLPPPLSVARLAQAGLPQEVALAAITSLHLASMLELREQGPGVRPLAAVAPPASPAAPLPAQSPGLSAARPPGAVAPPASPAAPLPAPAPSPGLSASPPPVTAPTPATLLRKGPAPERRPAEPVGGGLQIHRRSGGGPVPAPASVRSPGPGVEPARPPAPRPAAPSAVTRPTPAPPAPGRPTHETELASVRQRLSPLATQNYYQLLRVTPGSNPAQVDRAYRFLARRVEDEAADPGWRATLDLLKEAHQLLRDPERAALYAQLVERGEGSGTAFKERLAFEAEPKVDRALRAVAEGRTGEATFLLSWAEKLDPSRLDVPVLMTVVDFLRAPRALREQDARGLQTFLAAELARQPNDWRLKLCQALVLAELGDGRGAQALTFDCPELDHPMVRLVRSTLRA
jgi:hypothetical protein